MKKYFVFLICMVISLFAVNAFAYTPPPKPDNGWYILDQAGKLSTDQLKQLNLKLENLNKTTKNEYGALILQSLDGNSIEDVAQDTFRAWGIGKKDLNNGVLVVIAVSDRKSRIQTGKGVEGDLPDLLCNDILKKNLAPHLKSGDFFGGLNETFDTMSGIVANHGQTPINNAKPLSLDSDNDSTWFLAVFFGFGIISFVVWFLFFRDNKRVPLKDRWNDYVPPTPPPRYTSTFQHTEPKRTHAPTYDYTYTPYVAPAPAKTHSKPAARSPTASSSSSSYDYGSSSSSSSSYDSGSSSSSSYDSGSSFGGGDSGGGGSSGDW